MTCVGLCVLRLGIGFGFGWCDADLLWFNWRRLRRLCCVLGSGLGFRIVAFGGGLI